MSDLHHTTSGSGSHHRRHRPSLSRPYTNTPSQSQTEEFTASLPWEHMTKAYTWVAGQEELMKGKKRSIKTENWVREQQYLLYPKESQYTSQYTTTATRPRANKIRRHEWEELIYVYGIEADQWMRQEARARRLAEEREKTKIRIQEELRRIDIRLQEKREMEMREIREREEARRKASTERRDKEARDRAKLDKLILDAWASYESRWAGLASSSEPLEFKKTPWPLIIPPRNRGDLTRDAIVAFLFSPLHSQTQSRKDRIRSAQLRWHPDRFRKFMHRIPEEEKAAVEEGVGIVARCLNELMEREKKKL